MLDNSDGRDAIGKMNRGIPYFPSGRSLTNDWASSCLQRDGYGRRGNEHIYSRETSADNGRALENWAVLYSKRTSGWKQGNCGEWLFSKRDLRFRVIRRQSCRPDPNGSFDSMFFVTVLCRSSSRRSRLLFALDIPIGENKVPWNVLVARKDAPFRFHSGNSHGTKDGRRCYGLTRGEIEIFRDLEIGSASFRPILAGGGGERARIAGILEPLCPKWVRRPFHFECTANLGQFWLHPASLRYTLPISVPLLTLG